MVPPNLRNPSYRYGPRCVECIFYKGHRCERYSVEVAHFQVCDDWKKNPSLPTEVV